MKKSWSILSTRHTGGGRIVGEVHVNFVPVTYTKDHFERHDKRWKKVRHFLRGEGPLRPQIAQDKGYPRNESPIGKLFSGYRSGREVGKEMLVPGRVKSNDEVEGMNEKCKDWAEKFWDGHPDYQDDSKWWNAVIEADTAKRSSGGGGDIETVSPNGDSGRDSGESGSSTGSEDEGGGHKTIEESEDETDITIKKKEKMADLSGDYDVEEFNQPSIDMLINRLIEGDLNGRPIVTDVKSSRDIEFTINTDHPIFKGYGHSFMDMVLVELASILHQRLEDPEEWTPSQIFTQLKDKHCPDERLDPGALGTRAKEMIDRIRNGLAREEIKVDPDKHSDEVKEAVREEVFSRLGQGEDTVQEILQTTEYLEYAPEDHLVDFLEENPEYFFDGTVWDRPYETLGSDHLQDRVVSEFVSYLNDVIWLSDEAADHDIVGIRDEIRMELMRASYSLEILNNEAQV